MSKLMVAHAIRIQRIPVLKMYRFKAESDNIRASFSAEPENVDRLIQGLRHFLERKNLEETIFISELTAREALNNAIGHGCRNDSLKKVKFLFRIRGENIIMKIYDEGQGFPWRDHIYRHPEISQTSGRGLLILKTYSSEMSYNEAGNELVLTIPLSVACGKHRGD